jgi:hypothetical protein
MSQLLKDCTVTGTAEPQTPIGFVDQAANLVVAGPASGGVGPVTARKLVAADIPAAAGYGDLVAANNLSDVVSASTALTNLGGVSAATVAATYAPLAGPFPWADVTGEPTTLAGYGITDALKASNNLSDVVTPATARTNLGLGSIATMAATAFAAVANNLSDLLSAATARTNLGLGSIATAASTAYAAVANNLSDLASAATARTNLGLGSIATAASSAYAAVANNLSDLANAATARTNLGLGSIATTSATPTGDLSTAWPASTLLATAPVLGPAHAGQTDGATITWALASAKISNASVTLAGNRTLAITGATDGCSGLIMVKQDATGSRTLALPSGSKVAGGGAGAATLTTTAAAVDALSFYYDGTNYWWTVVLNFT